MGRKKSLKALGKKDKTSSNAADARWWMWRKAKSLLPHLQWPWLAFIIIIIIISREEEEKAAEAASIESMFSFVQRRFWVNDSHEKKKAPLEYLLSGATWRHAMDRKRWFRKKTNLWNVSPTFFASCAKVSDKRSYFLNTFQVGMGRKHQNGNLFAARAVKRSFRLKRNGNDSCLCIFTALKNDPPLASDAAKFLTEKNFTTEFPFLGQF